jgi:hypothetical protein
MVFVTDTILLSINEYKQEKATARVFLCSGGDLKSRKSVSSIKKKGEAAKPRLFCSLHFQ